MPEPGQIVLAVRIDQRRHRRNLGADLVMVEHDDIEAEAACMLGRIEARGATVDRHQKLRTAGRQIVDRLDVGPVTFGDTIRDVNDRGQPVLGEEAPQQRRRRRAVHIVVAEDGNLCSGYDRIRDALQKHINEGIQDDSFPIRPQRLVDEIRKVMPEDGILTLDNGMYKIWFARNYPATHPNTVLLDNALASMGAGLPSAMAAKMVHPDRRVMAVCGDGGFMMNSQELETAVRLRLDLVVLILRDDGYGMIKWKQKQMDFHDFGLDFQNPDFVAYAKAYGAQGHRVESTEGLGPLVEECFAAGGVHVIDLPVDYSDNDRVLNQEIRELSRKV